MLDCGFSYKENVVPFRKALDGSRGVETIDAFLRDRKEFIDFGRHMIAAALLPYEQGMIKYPAEDWYQRIYGVLNEDGFEGFGDNKLSIVTFNYDRSLEHFLHETLKHGHGRKDKDCAQQIKKIPIIHVHGQLGYLPWQGFDKNCTVDFGFRCTSEHVKKAAQEIKVVHEASENDVSFTKAREHIELAGRIYILGFGYDSSNLNRLGLQRLTEGRQVDLRGTAYKLGLSERNIANKHMRHSRYRDSRSKGILARLVSETVYYFLHDHVTFA